MKILQLIPNLSGGGAERFVADLCNSLSQNHTVVLITLYNMQERDVFYKDLSSRVIKYSLGKRLGFDYKIFGRLRKVIANEQPDIVHTHLRSLNYLFPLIPFLKRTAIVHTIHNDAFIECPNPKIRRIRKYFFKKRNVRAITISEESADSFAKAYPGVLNQLIFNGRKFPKKTKYFSDSLKEVNLFKTQETNYVFLNIGRQETQKNQLMLVEAFKTLIEKDKADAILLIMGGGRNNEESRRIQNKLIEAEKSYSYIHLLGEKSNATDYLYAADYFCLSSIYEGMPITLIEAFATGAIPVCTPVGGISEMLKDIDTSLLAKDVSKGALYKALKRAYLLPERKRQQFREKARTLFQEKYSMKICVKKYEKLYFDLLKHNT